MKTLAEIRNRFLTAGHAGIPQYILDGRVESAQTIADAMDLEESLRGLYRGAREEVRLLKVQVPALSEKIVKLERGIAAGSEIVLEMERKATKLREENSAMRAREGFLSNQNSCLRAEVRHLRDEITLNRGKNEGLMKALDEVAPFKWEYTPDNDGGEGQLKRREILTPEHPVYHGATTSRCVPADFSQIEGRVRRWVASGRSKFERGQLVNVVRGGFHLYRVPIVSVIFFTPEDPLGILGVKLRSQGEELGVKYLVRYNTIPGAYMDREVWAWMLELS